MTFVLQAENVTKTYKLGDSLIHAIKNVSFGVNKGDYLSIVGKSGSGKSTLMHLIGLLDTPTSGNIQINGKNTENLEEARLAKFRNEEIGFVFQSFNLLKRTTALENVMLPLVYSKVPKSEWQAKAENLLELVGLADRMYNKSNELSGGQRQRVAVARALINEPSILLADEPTGNLDSKTSSEIIELFSKLNNQGKTIIIVTHDDDVADITDKKITLLDGNIIDG